MLWGQNVSCDFSYTKIFVFQSYGWTNIVPHSISVAIFFTHYSDVKMGAMASQISGLSIVYSTGCSIADQRNIKTPRHWPLWGEFTGDRWHYHAILFKCHAYPPPFIILNSIHVFIEKLICACQCCANSVFISFGLVSNWLFLHYFSCFVLLSASPYISELSNGFIYGHNFMVPCLMAWPYSETCFTWPSVFTNKYAIFYFYTTAFIYGIGTFASLRVRLRQREKVKPVYNDHLVGYFSVFWSSSRWPS